MNGAAGFARRGGERADSDIHIAAAHALDRGVEFAFSIAPAIEQRDVAARLQAQHLHMACG